jgi:hypothetical protein
VIGVALKKENLLNVKWCKNNLFFSTLVILEVKFSQQMELFILYLQFNIDSNLRNAVLVSAELRGTNPVSLFPNSAMWMTVAKYSLEAFGFCKI